MKSDKIAPVLTKSLQGEVMYPPEVVDQILILNANGWGKKKIARELNMSRNTVKRYLQQKGWAPYKRPNRANKLQGLEKWLEETFLTHKGNCAVVLQELSRQHQIKVHLRTIEKAVKPFRQRLINETLATIRYETPPGKQLQIDFGSMQVKIAGNLQKIFFFAATLGYSRRQYVQAFLHERQSAWLAGIEAAFNYFGGITEEVLLDNAKPLVSNHNPVTREVLFNPRFRAFANYWKFKPKACAPYRARTKGKDERTVGYVKKNAIAGREFTSLEALHEHLIWWMREIADPRIHGTTGEKPIDRFVKDEAIALQPLNGRPPFCMSRELDRVVHTDACVEVETNFYSVPWHLIKQRVVVQLTESEVVVLHGVNEVARHPICLGEKQRSIHPEHLKGIIGTQLLIKNEQSLEKNQELAAIKLPEFLRPLSEYEAVINGGWL